MPTNLLKLLLLVLIISAISAFFIFDLQQYASLDYIKEQQASFQTYTDENFILVITLFTALYIFVTAFSLPAAAILTLLSGALFGVIIGTLIASFASSIGATLAFLMARFLAKDFIQNKYGKTLDKLNKGFQTEGAFYLFALRLVPVVPFFMINVVMALLPIPTRTFYWVSLLGMLPGTAVYVFTGTQLAQIESLGDIVSVPVLSAFVLLGLFPIIAKKALGLIRKENQHA